ncbi:hypothetical protein KEM54_006398 [Ascosphaera aggregata]|nr:hypothetical protein KEM54_006398 [Ascosphaera aggregata]
MSNKSIEQALAHLIPTHADALPPEIVSLASSLYAQSWNHGSALKPEEEIARPHACAEIACKRLSRTLRLPPLIGRPPCPPRMYGRIYKYIEGALAKASVIRKSSSSTRNSSRRKATGVSARNANVVVGSAANAASQSTLSSPSSSSLPSTQTAVKRTAAAAAGKATPSRTKLPVPSQLADPAAERYTLVDAPSWTMPLIRNVCKVQIGEKAESREDILARARSRTAFMAPHIFTGISHIAFYIHEAVRVDRQQKMRTVKVASQEPSDEIDNEEFLKPIVSWTEKVSQRQKHRQQQRQHKETNPPVEEESEIPDFKQRLITLIVALYLVVYSRFLSKQHDQSAGTSDAYEEMSRCALAVIGLYGSENLDDVDRWLTIMLTRGWTDGKEWFDNIPFDGADEQDGVEDVEDGRRKRRKVTQSDEYEGNDGGAEGRESNQVREGLLPGLATMMQDKLDYLSEERRGKYVKWEEGIKERINEMEREVRLN